MRTIFIPVSRRRGLAAKIRELRKTRGLSQRKLGELIGCNQPAVSHMETSGGIPTLPRLVKISTALGVPLSTFTHFLEDKDV